MNFLANPYVVGIVLVICSVIFYLANTGNYFGIFINKYFPCEQNPANSFPCFDQYDVVIMMIAGMIGIVCIGLLALSLYKTLFS